MGARNGKEDALSPSDIRSWRVGSKRPLGQEHRERLRQSLIHHQLDSPLQMAGRHFAMGCVALEITQRCNLDCTLCYLSDQSEAVRDLPLIEIFRRIDRIVHDYGPHTNVQITGGDPTLRDHEELVQIVTYAASRGLATSLFTNGIRATRPLLERLSHAGLRDVAFHVDLTQERPGYGTERDLNALRLDYISRAKGLGLDILFNTTVFDQNASQIKDLCSFFLERASDIHLCSFQLQAETGRGVLGPSDGAVSMDRIKEAISEAAGADLWGAPPQVGHPECNAYTACLVSGESATPLFDEPALLEQMFSAFEDAYLDRKELGQAVGQVARTCLRDPKLLPLMTQVAIRKLFDLLPGLVKSRGKVSKLTFYVHNFMDALALSRSRCEACVFMTMTRDGPISMCVHNAKRDAFITQVVRDERGKPWTPLPEPAEKLKPKRLKGLLKAEKERLSALSGE